MSTGLYLHPVGLVAGAAAIELKALGAALALAGGPLAFTGAFVIEGRPGKARSRFVTASALAGIRDGDVAALVARVRAPRAPFAGIDMGAARLMGIVNLTPDSFSDGGRLAGLGNPGRFDHRLGISGYGRSCHLGRVLLAVEETAHRPVRSRWRTLGVQVGVGGSRQCSSRPARTDPGESYASHFRVDGVHQAERKHGVMASPVAD